jgi:hypothetical protein
MKRRAISAAATAVFAWVMWAEYHATGAAGGSFTPEKWRIVNAFETKAGCDAEQGGHLKDMAGQGWRILGVTTGEKEDNKLLVTYRYLCLPGMLDPRPRK